MTTKEFNKRLESLFLPLDDKAQNETLTIEENIEYRVLSQVFEWAEHITIEKTPEEVENEDIIREIVSKFKKSNRSLTL